MTKRKLRLNGIWQPRRLLMPLWLFSACCIAQANGVVSPGDARVAMIHGNDYSTVVTYHSASAMSAYSEVITMYGSGQMIRHFYDARTQGRPPIKPGASQQEAISGIVVGARLLAAVFTDGSTFGDPKQVADLMDRRRAKLASLTAMASILCDAQNKGTDLQAVVGSLEDRSSRVSQGGGTEMARSIQKTEYTAIIDRLKRVSLEGADAVAAALRSLEASGAPLMEDPIKDPSGQLYVQETPARPACGAASGASLSATPRPAPRPYSAHPLIALRGGYYVRIGLATDRWPERRERVLRVSIAGDEITVVEFSRDTAGGAPAKDRPLFHGTYVSNPFIGHWGASNANMPMSVLSPERFLFGTEGGVTSVWNRMSDTSSK